MKKELERIAPCGLHCGKCFAFSDGDIHAASNQLRIGLGCFEPTHLRKGLSFAINAMSFPAITVAWMQIFIAGQYISIKQFRQSVSRNTMKKLRMNLDIDQ